MKFPLLFYLILVFTPSLAQQSYSIVFLNKKENADDLPKSRLDSISKGHMENMERLAKEGKLLAAGPFHGGGGIFIMNSSSKSEIEEWISTDPGVKAKRWGIEILPYSPRVGGICQVKAPYDMTNYSFIRYDAVVSKFNVTSYPQLLEKHHAHLKNLSASVNVITEAIFSEKDGGIMVINGEVNPADIESDPAVKEGLIDFQLKKLYIAKGSFCEQ